MKGFYFDILSAYAIAQKTETAATKIRSTDEWRANVEREFHRRKRRQEASQRILHLFSIRH